MYLIFDSQLRCLILNFCMFGFQQNLFPFSKKENLKSIYNKIWGYLKGIDGWSTHPWAEQPTRPSWHHVPCYATFIIMMEHWGKNGGYEDFRLVGQSQGDYPMLLIFSIPPYHAASCIQGNAWHGRYQKGKEGEVRWHTRGRSTMYLIFYIKFKFGSFCNSFQNSSKTNSHLFCSLPLKFLLHFYFKLKEKKCFALA